MKSDISDLLVDRAIDAIVVMGDTDKSTDLAYLAGGISLEKALIVKKANAEPVLFTNVLEREVAASTGYEIRLWSEFNLYAYIERHDDNLLAATVAQLSDILADLDVSGRVAFYGSLGLGYGYELLSELNRQNPHLEIIGEEPPNIFDVVRETKDDDELEAMKRVAAGTTQVIDSVISYIQQHRVAGTNLVKEDGEFVKIGDVKAHIRVELALRNLEEPHENIFSQGRDAGVPHNRGQYDMPLQLGQPIIFDIFPRDRASGYYHDITRTYFVGYIPDDMAQRYRQIKEIFDELLSEMHVGGPCSVYQHMTCDYFEALGYPSNRSNPGTLVGYMHSLGHGVGLDVHEGPGLNHMPNNTTILQPGHVVSVEPGLYYPDEGWGIRIEDTVAFDRHGDLINLSNYPHVPVIPLS